MAESAEDADYAAKELTEEGFIRLKVKMQGLKVKKPGILDKVRKNHPLPVGKNAVIDNPEISERSFQLFVRGDPKKEMRGANYKLVLQLPHSIDPQKSYLTAEEGWVFVYLKKVDEGQSWDRYIRDGALDVAENP